MTRQEFLTQKAEAEKKIRRGIVPFGLIYAVWFGVLAGGLPLVGLLLLSYFDNPYINASGRPILCGELAFCGVLLGWGRWAYGRSARRFVLWSLKCPTCGACLVFSLGAEAAITGRCPRCNIRIFDPVV